MIAWSSCAAGEQEVEIADEEGKTGARGSIVLQASWRPMEMDPPESIQGEQAVSGLVFAGIYSATGVPTAVADTLFWVVVSCTEIFPGAAEGQKETSRIGQTFEVTDQDEDDMTLALSSCSAGAFRAMSKSSRAETKDSSVGKVATSSSRIIDSSQLGQVAPEASIVALPLTWNCACDFLTGDANRAILRFELFSQAPSRMGGSQEPQCLGSKELAVSRLLNIETHTMTRLVTFKGTNIHLRVKLRLMFLGDPPS
eukprot:gnl/TRDRNA2_/TRDRNA2_166770_c1_seq4.p1 gnl/TRDRNA2_/TRDRNA2_166770_c1~~gnl/TRDRNA2_/TRDRNA2_166770_c1_seq4.p1  ORF type:complete len:255 (+),score=31.27 gnl/TRDRNA2_/TRDRNA2_166770_c1_seq4:339-1103(+)